MAKDYLSLTDNEFEQFFKRLNEFTAQKISGSTPEWNHIPETALTELQNVYDVWHTAFEKTIVPHTPIDTEAKNKAKKAGKAKIRPFVNLYLRKDQSAVTDMDRSALSIPNKDVIPTTNPDPDKKAIAEVVPTGKGKHTVTALNPESKDKKRPHKVKGVAFACRIRNADAPKNAANDMPSVFQVKTVRDFQWTEADYGKICDYAVAYENAGGKRGPWSDVVSLIIT